jgi:hypothetical protein
MAAAQSNPRYFSNLICWSPKKRFADGGLFLSFQDARTRASIRPTRPSMADATLHAPFAGASLRGQRIRRAR